MRQRPFTPLILTLIIILLLTGCTASPSAPLSPEPNVTLETVRLKLTWEHSVQFLGFYVAETQGFYADEGLAVIFEPRFEMNESSQIPARVAAGEFDFSVGSRALVNAQVQGVQVTAISTILQLNPLTFFARADSGIITPADLAGRRIAVKGEASRLLLAELLATANLNLEDVEEVSSGFDMTPFFDGDVDVWVGFITDEVIHARQQGLELTTFPLYEYGIQDTAVTLFTSQQMLNTNQDLVVRFLHASLRGWVWALDNPTEAVDIMLTRYTELAPEREFHLASFNAYIPLVRPPGKQVGEIDCQRWMSEDLFANLDSTGELCTTTVLETIWAQE